MYLQKAIQKRKTTTDFLKQVTTEQNRGVSVPAVQLTTHVKCNILYGRTVVRSYGRMVVRSYGRTVVWSYGRMSKFFRLDGLLLFCIIMELRSASSAINRTTFVCKCYISVLKLGSQDPWAFFYSHHFSLYKLTLFLYFKVLKWHVLSIYFIYIVSSLTQKS